MEFEGRKGGGPVEGSQRGMQGNGRGNEFPCPVDSVSLHGYLALAGAQPR